VDEQRAALLRERARNDWVIAAIAWRPQIDNGSTSVGRVHACFERVRALTAVDIDISYCPHPAGPPVCWCRKPLPGLLLSFAHRHDVALERSVFIGRAPADRTLADRLGMDYHDVTEIGPQDPAQSS
jgi:hypothetical protein